MTPPWAPSHCYKSAREMFAPPVTDNRLTLHPDNIMKTALFSKSKYTNQNQSIPTRTRPLRNYFSPERTFSRDQSSKEAAQTQSSKPFTTQHHNQDTTAVVKHGRPRFSFASTSPSRAANAANLRYSSRSFYLPYLHRQEKDQKRSEHLHRSIIN